MDIIDVGLVVSYILIILSALAAIIMPFLQSMDDPRMLKKAGIGLGAVVFVFLISYAVADPNTEGATEATSKMVGAGIISMYIFLLLAIGGIVYTEVSKYIK